LRLAASALVRQRLARRTSYAQCGEDLIAAFMLAQMGITDVRYLDIGANRPRHFSNTFLFYRRGSSGVLVEPDPKLCEVLRRSRPRDRCLQVASASQDGEVILHLMGSDALSTTSTQRLSGYETEGLGSQESITVEALSPGTILERGFEGETPDFVSLDVEGVDIDVLSAWDFDTFRPPVFCVETIMFNQEKPDTINQLMEGVGYVPLADTWINTIYVDRGVEALMPKT
jgi:FkbM family methyltransferase